MSSIHEIARATGLSSSTVARALRSGGTCAPQTRARVLAAARDLGYTPNHSAKTLRSNKTEKIIMCIPDLYNSFYFSMIREASRVCENSGYYLVLCHTENHMRKALHMIDELKSHIADGMIMVSFDFNERLVNAVNDCGMPVVVTNNFAPTAQERRFDCVTVNTRKGVQLATRHLIASGHRSIIYLGGDPATIVGKERLSGYLDAMREAGLPPYPGCEQNCLFTMEGGQNAMLRYLGARRDATAVMAANDLMAIGAMQAGEMCGLRVPGDISIIGMDDSDMARCTRPQLSSVIMKEGEIGRLAATLLLSRIANRDSVPQYIALEPGLVLRDSTAYIGL